MNERKRTFELSSASSYFYMPGEKVWMFADIELDEPVDAEVFEKAAHLTVDRFPYFKVKQALSEDGSRYVLEENDLPFPVREKNGYVDVFSDEANGYLFTLSYFNRHIFSKLFHGLTDGGGLTAMIRTLLKTYFELKDGRSFDCPGVKSAWDTPREEEWKDPMECLREVNREFHLRKQESFTFSEEKIDSKNARLYSFSVPEKVLVDYARRYEGGVSGAIALTLARAIDCLELENELPIRIACPIDMRKVLGCDETLRNCTKSAAYTHSHTLRSMSYENQLSVLKGQMMIQSSEEHQLPRCMKDKAELKELNSLPTVEQKRQLFSEVRLKNDPIVSYLGRFDMGELNDRIANVMIYGKVAGKAGIQNVCLCFKGRCHIYSSYNLKSESYIRMFVNEMRDFSYDCSPILCTGYDAPAKAGLQYRIIRKNSQTLNALLYSSNEPHIKYAVVAVHGYAGHKEGSAIQKLAERIMEREPASAVLSFDLPGHGSDTEMLSAERCDAYISAAAEFMRERYPDACLILSGTSFGGYLSLKYTDEHPGVFDKTVLRCPAVRMGDTLKEKILSADDLRTLREGGTVENGFDMKVTLCQSFLDELDNNRVNVRDYTDKSGRMLIVQGTADELVDCEDVKRFAAKNGIPLILSEGADHRFLVGDTMAVTIEDCIDFICR
ncbi:MAG: alpha/beta fold hydrolase [Eubacteriales bacterium]|nr:alpha/beta fold hydrolase [Eubacteriales bacterium]